MAALIAAKFPYARRRSFPRRMRNHAGARRWEMKSGEIARETTDARLCAAVRARWFASNRFATLGTDTECLAFVAQPTLDSSDIQSSPMEVNYFVGTRAPSTLCTRMIQSLDFNQLYLRSTESLMYFASCASCTAYFHV